MLPDVKVKHPSNHALNLLDARIAEFKDMLAIAADEMVVLPVLITFFIYSHIPAKLMTRYQITCNQMLYRIINSCTTHAVLFIFHSQVQLLCIEVFVYRIHLFQDGKPLRRFAAAALLKIFCKDFFYSFLCPLLFHTCFKSRNNAFWVES